MTNLTDTQISKLTQIYNTFEQLDSQLYDLLGHDSEQLDEYSHQLMSLLFEIKEHFQFEPNSPE